MGEIIAHYMPIFLRGDYGRISLGFKPSGRLHIGSVVTLMHAFEYARVNPGAKIEVQVMDLDYDFQRGNNFHSFYTAPDREDPSRLAKEVTKQEIEGLTGLLTEVFGLSENPAQVTYFSDALQRPILLEQMVHIMMDRDLNKAVKREMQDSRPNPKTAPFSGICPGCNHSNTEFPTIDRQRRILQANCRNESCDISQYYAYMDNVGEWNVFYLIDPIRDVFQDGIINRADVHLFGGDYARPYGANKTMLAQRVMNIMDIFSTMYGTTSPDIFIGPMVTWFGVKMGKCQKRVIKFSDVIDPRSYLLRLHDFVERGNRASIEFSEIEPELKGESQNS